VTNLYTNVLRKKTVMFSVLKTLFSYSTSFSLSQFRRKGSEGGKREEEEGRNTRRNVTAILWIDI